MDDICRLVQDTFHYHQVAVFSWEAVSGQLELIAFAGKEGNQFRVGSKLPVDKGILGYVARSGSPYLCNDTTKEQKYADVLTHTKAELALPLCFQHKVLGVLNIESAHINAFDDSDLEIFETIAEQVAHTIGNAALFRQKTSAHDLLLKLNTLSREINATFRLDKILHVTGSILPQTIGCRLCSIFFFNPQKNLLELKVHNLPGHELSTTLKVGSEENLLMTRVIQLKRSIHVTDIEKELRIPKRPKYQTKSFLNMLISYGKRIIGVLNLSDKLDDTPFSYEEFYLVYSFCEHLANAIMNCEKYQRILELSITDGLTGLHVHRYFQDSLQREISRSRRHNLQLCLIMMDIDDFKTFNDTYGHQVGDIVLRELANIIKTTVRSTDIAARYGGEEFAIILPHTDLLNGRILAERLQQKISNHPFDISGRPLHITVSQGLSEYKNQAAGTFILHADQALLQAKRQGKNRVNTYSAM